MNLEEIEMLDREILYPADVASFLRVNAQTIRDQAWKNPKALGFPVSVIGNKVEIPKHSFIRFWKGEPNENQKSVKRRAVVERRD